MKIWTDELSHVCIIDVYVHIPCEYRRYAKYLTQLCQRLQGNMRRYQAFHSFGQLHTHTRTNNQLCRAWLSPPFPSPLPLPLPLPFNCYSFSIHTLSQQNMNSFAERSAYARGYTDASACLHTSVGDNHPCLQQQRP
jgi:hypothetical protein